MLKQATALLFSTLLSQFLFSQSFQPAEPVSSKSLTKDFICEEMVYPEKEYKQKIEGEVKLRFLVGKDGSVSKLRIVESVNDAIDREAKRIFRMIEWKPATSLGSPVVSEADYTIPFNTRKYKKKCRRRGYTKPEPPFEPMDTTGVLYSLKQLDKTPGPVFKSEKMNFAQFVREYLEYPEQAFRQNLSGTVRLEFIVEPHGSVSNIVIAGSVGGGCNEEAIRLLKLLRWMPGIVDDTAVRSRMFINISFQLPSGSEHQLYDYNRNSSL
jgi:protein TonB